MNRRNQFLTIILLVQLALVAWVFWPRTASTAVESLFAPIAVDSVTAVRIEDGQNELQLANQGGQWVAPDADNYPANGVNVTKLISDVLSIDTSRLVARSPDSHGRLKVSPNDFTRRIELQRADGNSYVLYVGTSPNMNATHVRADGRDEVFLASGSIATDARTDLGGWIDTTYLRNNQDEITEVTIANASGIYTFMRGAGDAWTMEGMAEGEVLNQENVTPLLSRLAGMSMSRPLGTADQPEYALDTPQAIVTFTVKPAEGSEQTISLAIGAVDDTAGTYVAKASTSDYYVTIAKYLLQDFVERKRTDFVQPQPTPEAVSPITGTGVITGTEVATGTEVVTGTEAVTPAEPVTATETVTQ